MGIPEMPTTPQKTMIQFPQRKSLVAQVQRVLNLKDDGLDGRITWHALGTRFLPHGHPAMRHIHPVVGPIKFVGRPNLVGAVQASVGASVDGKDGSETWGAIMEALAPPMPEVPIAPPPTRSGYVERVRGRTPNRNAGVNTCEGIILHHCAGFFEGTISWCLRPKTYAGYHCLVAQDGTRAILATDEDRAHHAGRSVWRKRTGCNAFMLGLAFSGNTVTGARRPHAHLTGDEIASAREWMEGKMRKHNIPRDAITTHAVVSPGRKDDISPAAFEQVMSGW